MKIVTCLVLLAIVAVVRADFYMHNPRGSNNRLSEDNNNRNNANRLFDSQNNNRGGYNVGDSNTAKNGNGRGDGNGILTYYKTSILRVEWTNQHGGENPNVNTQVVFQYMCDDQSATYVDSNSVTQELWNTDLLRDGDGSIGNAANQRVQDDTQTQRGRHEPIAFYQHCSTRNRNRGLFIATENIADNASARRTRQDNAGTQYGSECPEERDYYPYWHPTPWKDIIVLTSNMTQCELYQTESQNVMAKGFCVDQQHNNRDDCIDDGSQWYEVAPWGIPAPRCEPLAFSRDNHLGNSIGGEPLHFNWTIPSEVTNDAKCVLRGRYNISTDDYDGWNQFYEEDEDGDVISPITDDPNVNLLKGTGRAAGVQLNVDVSQFGRTFQDRSHTFIIKDRPADIPAEAKIYNLNVRGRRGNIVQVYPAVEYDFIPRELVVTPTDYVHIAWTGSLSSPDGAGQGAANSDKNNLVCTASAGHSVPLTFADEACNLFTTFAQHENFATAGVGGATIDDLLNNAPATYDGGLIQPGGGQVGDYYFLNTRNNHFSNRSQRGSIKVVASV